MSDALEKAVRTFHERVIALENVMGALQEQLSMAPEAPINSAIWSLIGGYMSALDDAYSIGGWLEWWWMECGLGATPMQAQPFGYEMRLIATIDDFVQLVCDDLAEGGGK